MTLGWTVLTRTTQFEEADVVHQYGYGGDHDATHTSRPHPSPAPLLTSSNSGSGRSAPFLATRQVSSGSSYPPVMEESEEDAADAMTTVSGHGERASYFPDPYRQSPIDFRPRLDTQNSRGSSTSTGSGPIQTLSNLFHSHPERRDSEVRGGAHRGTRDYPHLPKEERDMENEERAALVRSDDEDERPVHRVEEQPRSAASDSSGSGGRAAGRKLPDAPRGPRPSGPR